LAPNQIQREDAKRRIIVGFNVRGRDVASIVEELQQKIEKQIDFPPGYYPTYGGQFENLKEAQARLSIAVPVALLLILMLLFFTFGSFKQSILIFMAIPMAAIGGVFALLLRGMPFSISAGIGFIALFGVAVLNGIVLIAEFNRSEESRTYRFIRYRKKRNSNSSSPCVNDGCCCIAWLFANGVGHQRGCRSTEATGYCCDRWTDQFNGC
jgi:cobalt-zinc-cadmium resistance protein CzcA